MNEINVFFVKKKTEQQPDCLNESELLTRSLHLTFKLCATQEPRLDMATALRVFSKQLVAADASDDASDVSDACLNNISTSSVAREIW